MVFLASSAKDFPRCTLLGYRNLGTNLYILSEGGGKFANLKKNKTCPGQLLQESAAARISYECRVCNAGVLQKLFT
jgi:hypothetical protein